MPPPRKKHQQNDLVPVPSGTRMVNYRYRGKIHKIPWYLHPDQSDFDDYPGDNEDSLMIFIQTGKISRKRLDFETRYAP